MPSSAEIRALVSLLADEDPKIVATVWEHLARLGFEAIPGLKEASEGPDPQLRLRARHALQAISLDDIEHVLQSISGAADDEFDLEAAFHALARIEYPELTREEVAWALDDIAGRVRPHLTGKELPIEKVRALNLIFHGEMGFTGVRGDLRNADAVCINRVLARRSGSPITLGVIYLLVATRLQLPVVGVGLPNHFLVAYLGEGEEIFIDPFHGAKIYGRREAMQTFLHDYYPKDSYIHWVAGREITIRALRSLILFYSKNQDKTRVRRLARFLEILQVRERTR